MNMFIQQPNKHLMVTALLFFLSCPSTSVATEDTNAFEIKIGSNSVTISAENALLNEVLADISRKCQLQITGLSYSRKDRITCAIRQSNVEKALQVLLKKIGKTSYAFEYRGNRLSRISVVPELEPGAFEKYEKENEELLTDENIKHFDEPDGDRGAVLRPAIEFSDPNTQKLFSHVGSEKNSTDDEDPPPTAVKVFQAVENTQAAELDIRKGDIVIEYNGVAIHEAGQLVSEVKKTTDDDEINMLILRDGEYLEMNLSGGQIGISVQTVPDTE